MAKTRYVVIKWISTMGQLGTFPRIIANKPTKKEADAIAEAERARGFRVQVKPVGKRKKKKKRSK